MFVVARIWSVEQFCPLAGTDSDATSIWKPSSLWGQNGSRLVSPAWNGRVVCPPHSPPPRLHTPPFTCLGKGRGVWPARCNLLLNRGQFPINRAPRERGKLNLSALEICRYIHNFVDIATRGVSIALFVCFFHWEYIFWYNLDGQIKPNFWGHAAYF